MMESTQEEDQTIKQGLYQRKRSDKELITYTQYVLGWAASEEFRGRTKRGLIYELGARVLQLSSEPFVVFILKRVFRTSCFAGSAVASRSAMKETVSALLLKTREIRKTRKTRGIRKTRKSRGIRKTRETRVIRKTRRTWEIRKTRKIREIRKTREIRNARKIRGIRKTRKT